MSLLSNPNPKREREREIGREKKNACTYLLNYLMYLFLFYVLYNHLFLIHVMDNALAILCKSCQKAHLNLIERERERNGDRDR